MNIEVEVALHHFYLGLLKSVICWFIICLNIQMSPFFCLREKAHDVFPEFYVVCEGFKKAAFFV